MEITQEYKEGDILKGVVKRIVDYGCEVEIEESTQGGFIYTSEMHWTNKNIHPSKIVEIGQTIDVMVLEIKAHSGRLNLGFKQCQPNPWKEFEEKYKPNDKVWGVIDSFSMFGPFVKFENETTALIHSSDLSEEMSELEEGDKIEVTVISVDSDRERISVEY